MDVVEHFVCFVLTIVILLKYLIYVSNKYCHDIKIYTYTIYVIRTSYNKNNKAQVSSTCLYLTPGYYYGNILRQAGIEPSTFCTTGRRFIAVIWPTNHRTDIINY